MQQESKYWSICYCSPNHIKAGWEVEQPLPVVPHARLSNNVLFTNMYSFSKKTEVFTKGSCSLVRYYWVYHFLQSLEFIVSKAASIYQTIYCSNTNNASYQFSISVHLGYNKNCINYTGLSRNVFLNFLNAQLFMMEVNRLSAWCMFNSLPQNIPSDCRNDGKV